MDALAAAMREYDIPQAVVIFVVQPGEKNSYDQQVGAPANTCMHDPALRDNLLVKTWAID